MSRTVTAEDLTAIEKRILVDARQALVEARAAVDAIDRETDKPRLADALALVGRIAGMLDDHDTAVLVLTEAADLYRELDNPAGYAGALHGLGAADLRRGRMAEALDRFEEAHALSQQTGDRLMAMRALNAMGTVYGTFRDYREAIRLYEQALREGRALGPVADIVLPCCNLAQTCIIRVWESEPDVDVEPDVAAAWAALEQARAAVTETTPVFHRLFVQMVLAQCQNLRGLSMEAIETSRGLLVEAAASNLVSVSASGHRELASAYLALGRFDEAAAAAQQAVDLFTQIKFVHETTFPLRHLAIAEERRGNYPAALAAERRYYETRQRVLREGAERHATFVKTRVALEQAQAHAKALQAVNEQLLAAKLAAEAARDAKGAFLSMMGHELRSPLQAILGFSSIIAARTYGDDAIGRYVEAAVDIHNSGQHLLQLINQILDYSKGEVGKLRLEEGTARLSQIVQSAIRMVGDLAARGSVRLKPMLDRELYLKVDELKLTQCLLNTLSNAVKFTPPGGEVDLSAAIEPDWVALCIRDTGWGIAPEDIPKVFEPFGQGRNAVGREGTGLGVPLSKMLMELHGGTLEIESRVGEGTSVFLRLPLDRLVDFDTPVAGAPNAPRPSLLH